MNDKKALLHPFLKSFLEGFAWGIGLWAAVLLGAALTIGVEELLP